MQDVARRVLLGILFVVGVLPACAAHPAEAGVFADFDADGKSDILWRNDNGTLAMWLMNGFQIKAAQTLPVVSNDWHVAGIGDDDLNRNFHSILWRNDNGATTLWWMSGFTPYPQWYYPSPSVDWHVAGLGDFFNFGSDILWRNDDGTLSMWHAYWGVHGGRQIQVATLAVISTDWHVVGIGDFDGDGESDILWRNDNGAVAVWLMNGFQTKAAQILSVVSTDWHVVGTGDFDGDGRSDILISTATAGATSCGATTTARSRCG